MPGTVIRAVPKAQYDFHTLASGASSPPIVIAKGIDVTQYKYVNMAARIHAGSINQTGCSVTVDAFAEAPSPEDPSLDFIGASALNTFPFSGLGPSTTYPQFALAPLMGNVGIGGGWSIRIRIMATQGSTPASSFLVTVSVDIYAQV